MIVRLHPGTATISNTGDSNFSVWFYGDSTDLLVNEIGPYEGVTRLPTGPAPLEIDATGDWLITPGQLIVVVRPTLRVRGAAP